MEKNIKVIATAIPRKKKTENGKTIFTAFVYLTPRLPDTKDGMHASQYLSEYPVIRNWPFYHQLFTNNLLKGEKQNNISFRFFNGETDSTIPADVIYKPYEANKGKDRNEIEKDAQKFWNGMFSDETPVTGWILDERAFNLANSLRRVEITSDIRNAIDKCIDRLLGAAYFGNENDPFKSDGNIENRRKEMASFVNYLEQLKSKPIEQLVLDPILVTNEYRPYLYELLDTLVLLQTKWKEELSLKTLLLSLGEIQERNYQEANEFHKRLSNYSGYIHVLRKTGWLLEYDIVVSNAAAGDFFKDDTNKFIDVRIGDLSSRLLEKPEYNDSDDEDRIDEYLRFFQDIGFIFPRTAISFNKGLNHFECAENLAIEKRYEIQEGAIVVNPKNQKYKVEAHIVDLNQLQLKISDIADKIKQKGDDKDISMLGGRAAAIDTAEEQKYLQNQLTQAGTAEYISSGISIQIENLSEITKEAINNSPEAQSNLSKGTSDAYVYYHNIHAGFRVDVSATRINSQNCTGSLCLKEDTYLFPDNSPEVFNDDEGWIAESIQGSSTGDMYTSEELCRWNDWSLVAKQPGEHEISKYTSNQLSIDTWPRPFATPALRLGHSYRFRLRTVNICGDGKVPDDKTPVQNDLTWTAPLTYKRVDPIHPPFLVNGSPIYEQLPENEDTQKNRPERPKWTTEHFGEDVATLVIRSVVSKPAIPGTPTKLNYQESTVRYLAPPKANLNFVLQHGVLDTFIHSAYNFRNDEARKEILKAADASSNGNIEFYIKSKGTTVEYLFDPLVIGYELVTGHTVHKLMLNENQPKDKDGNIFVEVSCKQPENTGPNFSWNDDEQPAQEPADIPRYWQNKPYYQITLTESKDDILKINQESYACTLLLRRGHENEIQLGCLYGDTLKDDNGSFKVHDLFMPGVPLTKRTAIRIIHAVQKPCLLFYEYNTAQKTNFAEIVATSIKPGPINRKPGNSTCSLQLHYNLFPVLTSEMFRLHVAYVEFTCNRLKREGFEVKLIRKVVKSGFVPDDPTEEKSVMFSDLEHFFDDTRYRKVSYSIEAVSKFKKYFDPTQYADFSIEGTLLGADPVSKININSIDPYTLTKEYSSLLSSWVSVQNSKRPDIPVVSKIVPLLRWENDTRTNTVKRFCDTIRIYFEGDWFSSGPDEKLAVLYSEHAIFNSGNVVSLKPKGQGYTPTVLDNAISQFGLDPTVNVQPFSDGFMINKDFLSKSCAPGVTFIGANDKDPKIYLRKMDPDQNDDELSKIELKAVVYPVRFVPPYEAQNRFEDEPKNIEGSFYVDVQLDNEKIKNLYFPYVRLAIARYQENSIPQDEQVDYRFSKIVTTNFVQLLPYREISIEKDLVKYHAPSLRFPYPPVNDAAGNPMSDNELYVFQDGKIATNVFSIPEKPVALVSGKVLSSGSLKLQLPKGTKQKSLIIYEFEQFHNEKETVDPATDPREDFTKRAVFSYVLKFNNKPTNDESDDDDDSDDNSK